MSTRASAPPIIITTNRVPLTKLILAPRGQNASR